MFVANVFLIVMMEDEVGWKVSILIDDLVVVECGGLCF